MVRKDIFVTALIITVFIFIVGFWLGTLQDELRVSFSDDALKDSELDTESLLTEKLFLEEFGGDSCTNTKLRLESFNKRIYEVGQTLIEFEGKKVSNQEEYDFLKRKYHLIQANVYVLKHKLQKECGEDSPTILFFFDIEDNEESIRQGLVLDSLVKQAPVTILSFDREFQEEPLLELIKGHYGITKSPTLIINFKTKKEGYINVPELKKLLDEKEPGNQTK